MLKVEGLRVAVADREVLKGVDLEVLPGEVHAIMGPNGSGKSTLSMTLAGRSGYQVLGGSVTFNGEDLLRMEPEERAGKGIFLGFQYPVELPGVSNLQFLRSALNAQRATRGEEEISSPAFMARVRELTKELGMRQDLLKRGVNEGFSGGEKKRNEIFQMALFEPRLAILDEIDSGLDIDALKAVAEGVNSLRHPERSVILVTHYQRLLDYIVPDKVHVMMEGRIRHSGDQDLALTLERQGYAWLTEAQQ